MQKDQTIILLFKISMPLNIFIYHTIFIFFMFQLFN